MPRPAPEKKRKARLLAAWVPPAKAQAFERLADRNHRTVSQEIRRLVDEALEQEREVA